jgi:subtilisin family serine protease
MSILMRTVLASAAMAVTGLAGVVQAAPSRVAEAEIAHIEGYAVADVDLPIGVDGRMPVFVQFAADPTSVVYSEELQARGGPRNAAAVAQANRRAQVHLQAVRQVQDRFLAGVAGSRVKHDVLFRAARSVNGVALRIEPKDMAALRQLPGVVRVEVMYPEELHNASSTPFIGSPQVWSAVDLVRGSTGRGVSIGIIDTGIDYQHAHFGGTGLLEDYQANDRSVISDTIGGQPIFPTAKVVGGYDFAGDAYTGSNVPVPNPDPMDCNGHGSHVAGSAAGFGVTSNGQPYAGPFDTQTDFGSLRIGPGVAPEADLYALRVFGCSGSTNLTVAAIEWAMDPNGDGDFGDRLDVINMSLGSNFGDRFNASAIASDNAARVGIIVVASAGNAADTFFITGSPGASGKTISVASSLDSFAAAAPAIRVNSPAAVAGFYGAGTASFGTIPPPGGLTGNLVLVEDGTAPINDGCETITNAAEVAGKIAFIDRGNCGFQVKAVKAQEAGAIGVVIANIAAGAAPGMGVTAGEPDVTIPAVSITLDDANLLRDKLTTPGVSVTLFGGADTPSSFTSRGPRRASPLLQLKPDVAAPGQNITSALTGVTGPATFAAGSQPRTISGTSMAAPHIAGAMALLRDLHPNLSVEEYKALLMNTARHSITSLPEGAGFRHGGSRVGAGRVDVPMAAAGQVLAFSADDPGLVSVSFDSAVRGTVTRTKSVRLVNHGPQSQTFSIGMDTVIDAPGVAFSAGAASVVVPGNGSALVTVRMDAVADEIVNFRDPTLAATQAPTATPVNANLAAAVPRHYMTEESARLTFSRNGQVAMRVPVYAAVYPESAIVGSSEITTGGAASGSTSITLSGQGVCTGDLAGALCSKPDVLDQSSIVTPFELQGISPRSPFVDPARDIRFVGVGYTAASNRLHFGFASWGPWSSPTDVAYRIDIDCGVYALGASFTTDTCTGAPDGVFDLRIVMVNRGTFNALFSAANTGLDVHQVFVIGLQPTRTGSVLFPTNHWINSAAPNVASTRAMFNEVQFVPIDRTIAKIGGAFDYRISTCFGLSPLCAVASDTAGPYRWNHTAQGLDFGGAILADAQAGGAVPVTFNTANMTANGSLGALLLHHFNGEGNRAQLVVLEGAQQADGSVAIAVDNPNAPVGSVVTVTLTAANTSTTAINGASVAVELPAGVQALGDNGGGTFSNGVWTVGNLSPGTSAKLNVLLRVIESGPQRLLAQFSATSPVDGSLDNNRAAVWINAASTADLAIGLSSATSEVVGAGSMNYTITLQNNGPDQAFNVNVAELFVNGGLEPIMPTSATASVGGYNGVTGIWTIPSMSATTGAPATLELSFSTTGGSNTTAVFRATVTSDASDPDTSNNVVTAETQLRTILIFRNGFEN